MNDRKQHLPSFETTHWSVVLGAGAEESSAARIAVHELCRRYWFPLFAFLRRKGYDEATAEDLVQSFFVRVIERNVFSQADRQRGRFRTFLLTALINFLSNENAKTNTLRRGGGKTPFSLSARDESGRLINEIADETSPADEYDRQWAMAVLKRVLDSLRREYEDRGAADQFDALRHYLVSDKERKPYAEVANALGTSESNVKVSVHRLRGRYRNVLEVEIAQTVESPSQVEDEILHLFQALQKK